MSTKYKSHTQQLTQMATRGPRFRLSVRSREGELALGSKEHLEWPVERVHTRRAKKVYFNPE